MIRNSIAALLIVLTSSAAFGGIEEDIQTLHKASGTAPATAQMQAAWQRLANVESADAVLAILGGMQGASPAAENWLRSAADAAFESAREGEGSLDEQQLVAFVRDESQSPRARRVAFEWFQRTNPQTAVAMLDELLTDPSLEIRYDANQRFLDLAEKAEGEEQKKLLRQVLTSARNFDQLQEAEKRLEDLGEEIDLPRVMGFVRQWSVIGPFDNTGLEGFDAPYAPEREVDHSAVYEGKSGEVKWQTATAKGDGGELDLNELLGDDKEVVAYALASFRADGGSAEVRWQSKNATKVWVNDEPVGAYEVYHSGGGIDQYRAAVELYEGENVVLVKIAQNEKAMPWESEWDFRLRVVDPDGAPAASQAPVDEK